MWMLMEGVVLYVALVQVFVKKPRRYILGFTVISYGLPALYLCLTVPLGMVLGDEEGPHYGASNASNLYVSFFKNQIVQLQWYKLKEYDSIFFVP